MNDSDLAELALAGAALFLRRSMYDLQQQARRAGISLAQMHVLLHLYGRGPSEVMEFVDVMQSSPAGASQMVERLAQQGLVQRQERSDDRRVREVHLTAKGRQVVESSLAERRQWLEGLLASLGESEKDMVGQTLRSLLRQMAENEGHGRPDAAITASMDGRKKTMLTSTISRHLHALAVGIGSRPTGSEANRRAEDYIAGALAAADCAVERQAFSCLDWEPVGVELRVGEELLQVRINPFSPSCQVAAPMVAAGSLAELDAADLTGKIAVLHGELTAEPLFPRHFPFLTFDEHVRIIETLEQGRPAAVIAVSRRESNPAPIIEDGDFSLPSVTIPASAGRKLLAQPGAEVGLSIHSEVRLAAGANVIGRKPGAGGRRMVICAHFDTKPGTPGALDNAAGVATMLALAEILAPQDLTLEFVAFDGEDYFSAPGEVVYLRAAGESLHEIDLVVNIDGVGLAGAGNTIALFDPPPDLAATIRQVMARHPQIGEAEPWPQSDHSIFLQRGVPAVAFTSAGVWELIDAIVHTENDTVERVSAASLAEVVAFIADLIDTRGRS